MDLIGRLHFLLILVIVMIVSSCLAIIGNKLLYITPSPSVTCPGKPCLTLYQFAASVSRVNSSTTLVFLPGIHRLNLEVSVSGISNFSMLSKSTLEGFQVNISCYQSASFKFDNMDNLLIRGLKFIGCGDNKALSVKLFNIENSIFQGQNYSGTALEVNETNVEIRNSLFTSNIVGRCFCIITVADKTGDTCFEFRVGGAIFSTHSNVTIMESNFVGNSAEMGGAIYIRDFSNVTIINSTFVKNQAANADFNIQCSNSVLYRNPWTDNKMTEFIICEGGAIVMFESKLIINNSTFNSSINKCVSGGAGALSIQDKSDAKIYDSEFRNNSVKGFGGALTVARSCLLYTSPSPRDATLSRMPSSA